MLVLSALWGAVYLLIEIALRQLSPPLIVFGRMGLAALVLVPLAIKRGAFQALRGHLRIVLGAVLVQLTVPSLLLTFGQLSVSSALAGILVGAQPLFVTLLAVRFSPTERSRGWRGPIGIAVGFIGLVLIFGVDLSGGEGALIGGLLLLIAAFCYAAGAIMIHRWLTSAEPLGIATSGVLVTTVALSVPAMLSLPDQLPGLDTLLAVSVLGLVCTGFALVLHYHLIASFGPTRAALAFYLSPAFAMVYSTLLLNEGITVSMFVGLIAIIVGSVLAWRRPGAPLRYEKRLHSASLALPR